MESCNTIQQYNVHLHLFQSWALLCFTASILTIELGFGGPAFVDILCSLALQKCLKYIFDNVPALCFRCFSSYYV